MYTIWRFDGSGGCEQCGAMTGEYPSNPGKPHPNCNCSVTKVVIDEICTLIDSSTIEMVIDSIELDWGPGTNPNTRLIQECEEILSVTDRHWRCCKVENYVVTEDCYEHDTTTEDYFWRCSEPTEVPVEETPLYS